MTDRLFDALLIGSGPAALSAALSLSRVRRSSLVVSMPSVYRNSTSSAIHTLPTREGVSPLEFRRLAMEELRQYGFSTMLDGRVSSITKMDGNFKIQLEDNTQYYGKAVIMAFGVKDLLPEIEGNSLRIG